MKSILAFIGCDVTCLIGLYFLKDIAYGRSLRVCQKFARQTDKHFWDHLDPDLQRVSDADWMYIFCNTADAINPGTIMLVASILVLMFMTFRNRRKTPQSTLQ